MFKSLKVPGIFIVDKAGEVEDEREPKLTGDEPKVPHSGSLGKIRFVVPPSAAKLHPHQRRERRGYGRLAISVSLNGGQQYIALPQHFTLYAPTPAIERLLPKAGPLRGGTKLQLLGYAFLKALKEPVLSFASNCTKWDIP